MKGLTLEVGPFFHYDQEQMKAAETYTLLLHSLWTRIGD